MSATVLRCETCKFLLKRDMGYSNYTVTDTELHCLKKLNPLLPKDEDYRPEGADPALSFGATCGGYVEGDGLHTDVEMEDVPHNAPENISVASYYTSDPEIIAAFEEYENSDESR